jgi:RimJ/RimL family protein N-acetyltransferase
LDRTGSPVASPDRRRWATDRRRSSEAGVCKASAEEPEIAYEFARRIHGNGYATEAVRIVVAEGAATGRSRLWATVRDWNTPSIRVLEKVGFRDSGRITPDPERGTTIWMTLDLTTCTL